MGLFALFALLAMSACGGGSPVHIYDNAHVLDDSSVQSAASNLSYPLDIYTTSTFTGDRTSFDRTTASKLNGDANRIVMAIDTTHKHIYIAYGRNVPLTSSEVSSTVSAFASHFNGGDYTGATLAAVDTMRQSLGTGGPAGGNPFAGALPTLLCIGLLLLVLVGGFAFMRRRRFGGVAPAPYQPPPAYPYNQGNAYPYNQGNYYGPPQGGMNPWAAGGLGAAAGGLIGYELGKEAGEHERRDYDAGGDAFGGGGGGDFGGGGGDFGGGGGDFGGGGGDFGGGGGDFGGGGGDFGGGGGGDF